MFSDFLREVGENCDLLGHYVASSGNSFWTFREDSIGPTFKGQEMNLEGGTDGLFGKAGKGLLLLAA